jgi:hypothetical protein
MTTGPLFVLLLLLLLPLLDRLWWRPRLPFSSHHFVSKSCVPFPYLAFLKLSIAILHILVVHASRLKCMLLTHAVFNTVFTARIRVPKAMRRIFLWTLSIGWTATFPKK